MTWAKLDDTFIDDPHLLALPRGVRLLYVESIVWSCKHLTDGHLPAHVISRFTDEQELTKAIDLLVEANLWARTDAGLEIVGFLDSQPSKEKVKERLADTQLRKKRSEQHYRGDHSLCLKGDFCPNGAVTREGARSRTRAGTRSGTDTRPDPSRPDLNGGTEGEGVRAGARPPLGSAVRARTSKGFTFTPPAIGEVLGG